MANLGGGVIKLRLSRVGEGKSGGLRSILLFRAGDRAIYAYGYAKSDRDDIELDELRAFRALARVMLALDREGLDHAMRNETIREINCDA